MDRPTQMEEPDTGLPLPLPYGPYHSDDYVKETQELRKSGNHGPG